jgi:TatD DNase family protein
MTTSLDEATLVVGRPEPFIIWGPGCHPRKVGAQQGFDAGLFRALCEQSAVVGEIGLDLGTHAYGVAPPELQLRHFRQALQVLAGLPRLVSIHAYRANAMVLDELRRTPIRVPVLHWWTGSADESCQAVELGCYFSVHSAVARQSKFRSHVPPDRVLVETDHGYDDPPAAIPCRVEWVEHLVGQQYGLEQAEVRRLVWRNFAAIVRETGTRRLLPAGLGAIVDES